ncbi:hypothetical protein ACH5RR_021757 [Cinchona calisaya]|uniref:Uncharacterized protein n=1 Tax=Cinchona calisaya TaxID=153742 RepID=A0ABD2ZN67_9GENT
MKNLCLISGVSFYLVNYRVGCYIWYQSRLDPSGIFLLFMITRKMAMDESLRRMDKEVVELSSAVKRFNQKSENLENTLRAMENKQESMKNVIKDLTGKYE